MLLNQEGLLHKGPEFCQAVKFVIKLQISTLLQQLAESGEESVVLTANVLEGTADHLGSHRGNGFLDEHGQLGGQFLAYCAETRRPSVDDEADNLPPRTLFSDNNLLSPTLAASASPYSRDINVRARYERESSTSDSVFSPDRRKSSASSKSLDEDVAMLTGQDYSDTTTRSLSDSSATWPEGSGTTGENNERSGVSRYGGINRSPTTRSAPESFEKISSKHAASKSPMSESVEHIKQITLSSPSEFQLRKYHQHAGSGANFPGSASSGFDPQRLPPMYELVSPGKPPPEFVVPNLSSDNNSASVASYGSGNVKVENNVASASSGYGTKSGTDNSAVGVTGSGNGGDGRETSGTGSGSKNESDAGKRSPVLIQGSSPLPQSMRHPSTGGQSSSELSPMSVSESVFTHYPVYKVPFTNYSDRTVRIKAGHGDDSPGTYRTGYEGEGLDSPKFKSHFIPPEVSPGANSGSTEPYSSLTESREYQSEMGEIYRLPKKGYHQRHGSGSSRKQAKSSAECRVSDSAVAQAYETIAAFSTDPSKTPTKETISAAADISKTFEEAVKIQQSLFQSSLGLLSPLQRQFLTPPRPYPQRERSQSLSEFHTSLATHELSHHPGRARFPSSSFAENLDAPLVIDDDGKSDVDPREGLDLSNKKRKMSVDDAYSGPTGDDPGDSSGMQAGGAVVAMAMGSQGDEEYERSLQIPAGGGTTGSGSREEQGTSTKKYGKGNFIKVATGYQCRICCRVIRHMNNTTAHMRIHANVKPYKCQVCNQQFKYEVDRRYHFSKNHVDLFSKMYYQDEKKSG